MIYLIVRTNDLNETSEPAFFYMSLEAAEWFMESFNEIRNQFVLNCGRNERNSNRVLEEQFEARIHKVDVNFSQNDDYAIVGIPYGGEL